MRDKIVSIARRYVGTPYRHQGRSAQGLDCVGLIVVIADELGIDCKDVPNYRRRSMGTEFFQAFNNAGCRQKSLAARLPGDIIILKFGMRAQHAAILTDRNTIIHAFASTSRSTVIEEHYSQQWIDRSVACYAFPGVDK